MDWDSSDVAENRHMLEESLTESFTDFEQTVKRIFSGHAMMRLHRLITL
jgi:hypothetical protein